MIDAKKLAELRPYLVYDPDFVELCDTLEAALKVVEAAKETRDAAAYLMRFIAERLDPKLIGLLAHKYDGFGKRIDQALAPFRSQPEVK